KKLCSCLLLQVLYYTDQFDKMIEHVQIIQDDSENNPASLYSARLALLFYHFSRREFDKAKKVFYQIIELFAPDDKESRLQIIKVLCVLSRQYQLPYSFIEDELLLAEACGESQLQYVNYVLHYALFEYYLEKGNKEVAYQHLVKSHKGIEKSMESLYSEKVVNFQFIERSFSIQEDISTIQRKNNELKMIAEESIRNRKLAESISDRLRLVNELGKKLTQSLDLQGIGDIVYKSLLNQLPLDNFLIMIKDQESNVLRTILFYEKGERKENIEIDADTERSAFVETFKSNRRIVINDYHTETRFHRPTTNLQKSARSVLFLPISVENNVLGACSVQHMQPDVYTQDHIDFLEDLMPYLAIALNNAFKSAALENEIERRRQTQEELKLANRRLEMLSYLDGLTQISNRRDFENRVLDYLGRSKEHGLLISIFMFDIDFFKCFNDTYGHLAGDEALKSVATIVHKHFESVEGISARFGGEEFVAACLGLDEEQSVALGNRIREDVLALGIANENTPLGTLSISVGIALAQGAEPAQKSALMRWADLSLYQAKTSGKNRVVSKVITSEDSATDVAPN
ncbi:MAG: diguanylate cyclase, partial [Bacillota bacterium]|nr:diguanylate cyclase [Bacillota bacterium]